jgi:hypothetical protein
MTDLRNTRYFGLLTKSPAQATSGSALSTTTLSKPGRRRFQPFWWLLVLLLVAELGLFLAHQIPAHLIIGLNRPEDAHYLVDFYDVEADPAGGHRWSHPQAKILIPAIDAAPTIRLNIENQVAPGTPPRSLSYGLLGQDNFISTTLKPGLAPYDLLGKAGPGFFSPAFATRDQQGYIDQMWLSGPVLQLETAPFAVKGDRRELGVVVQSVEIKAGITTGRIGLPTLATVLLTAVISLTAGALLNTFRLSFRKKFLLALAFTTLWLGLVAFGRVWLATNTELSVILVILLVLGLMAARFGGPLALADGRQFRRWLAERGITSWFKPVPPSIPAAIPSEPPPASISWTYRVAIGIVLFAFAMHLFSFVIPWPAFQFDADNFSVRELVEIPWSYISLSDDYNVRSFGLHFLLNLPWPLIAVMALAVFLTTFPPTNRRAALYLERLTRWYPLAGRQLAFQLIGWLFIIGVVILFCLVFRTRIEYGDHDQIIYKLERLKNLDALPGPGTFLIWREGEILDYASHFLLWRLFENTGWWKPEYTYTVTSALAGGLYVVLAWLLAVHFTQQRIGRFLISGLLLTLAGTLLFMGYVESYTLVTLSAMAYIVAAVWAFAPPNRKPISIVWPAFLLGLTILLHPQAIFLGPSFVVGLLWRAGLNRPDFNWRKLAIEACQSAIIGGLMLAGLVFFMGFYNYTWNQWDVGRGFVGGYDLSFFKPLFAVRSDTLEFYPILSLDYFRFQFNLQMLLAPGTLLLLVWLSFSALYRQPAFWRPAGLIIAGTLVFIIGLTLISGHYLVWLAAIGMAIQLAGLWLVRRRLDHPAGLVLGTAALYTWIFSLIWNPDLGTHDWDLLSLNGFFTTTLLGYWLVVRLEKYPGWLARVSVALLTSSICLWFAWVSYNAFFH